VTAPLLRSRVIERTPIHYSWVALTAGTSGFARTIPGQTVGVSVFLDLIIGDLGMQRSTVSFLYTIGTLVGSFSLPFVGRAVDRHGPRRAVLVIGTGFAVACGFMGTVNGVVMLAVGFTLIRGFGQGALGLVSMHSINLWFVRRRGLAVGLAGLGFALATATVPVLLNTLIGQVGWRTAYAILGVFVAAVVLPVCGGLFRFAPERYGLEPDGRSRSGAMPVASTERNLPLGVARRTLTFWLYTIGSFLSAMLGTGLVFHHFSIMAANGIDRDAAATVFLAFGVVLAASNLVTGWLLDRIPPRFLLAVAQAALASALLMATRLSGSLVLYGVLLGVMQGMMTAIGQTVYAHYFGRAHLGSIKGMVSTITVAGTALGPLAFAVGFEQSGSYRPVLTLAALAPLAIAVIAPWLRLFTPGGVR